METHLPGCVPLGLAQIDVVIFGTARANPKREKPLARLYPAFIDPAQIAYISSLVLHADAEIAVTEQGAVPHRAMRLKLGVGKFRRDQVMRPIMNGGEAGIDRLGNRQPNAAGIVFWFENRADRFSETEIAHFGIVAGRIARRSAPHMPMSFDETRQGDHILAVDDFRTRRLNALADSNDRAVADMDIAIRHIAQLVVHRQDIGAADQKLAPRGKRGVTAARCLICGLRPGHARRHRRRGADSRRAL